MQLVNRTIDPLLGMPPSIDVRRSFVNVTINENDYPYGVIGFERSRVIYHEWEGFIRIPVIRQGMSSLYFNCVNHWASVESVELLIRTFQVQIVVRLPWRKFLVTATKDHHNPLFRDCQYFYAAD